MTPFYTALSIWVGGLLMVSLLSVDNKHEHLQPIMTKRQVYLGKIWFLFLLGIIQALIVSIGDLVILKASMNHRYYLSLLPCLVLSYLIRLFTSVSLLGNPGKAVAIILCYKLLVEEVHFPIQTTPEFFQAISPYLPFTYSIDALRETVGGIVPEILITKVIILGLFGIDSWL